ncbi:hypothetical protein MRX96_021928 [Rhipicephalus microplus]
MDIKERVFADCWLNYKTPCTSSEGHPCNIFEDLRKWNAFFWAVGFELRELSPGQLSFVKLRETSVPSVISKEDVKDVVKLLRCLLMNHHCVVSVDLNCELFKHHHQSIFGALSKRNTVTKLNLGMPRYALKRSLIFILKLRQLKHLRDLVLFRVPFDRKSVKSFSAFLESTRSLMTLDITDVDFGYDNAIVVIQGLQKNATITTLSIDMALLPRGLPKCGAMFSDYLSSSKMLRTLNVTSLSRGPSANLAPITCPLHHNATVSVLNLMALNIDLENHKLITDMLRSNRTLIEFHMTDCFWDDYDSHITFDEGEFADDSSPVPMWLVALAENEVLQQLTLDLSWIEPYECDSLVKALARHTSLTKVTVQTIRDNCAVQICRSVRDTGVPQRFSIATCQLSEDTVPELQECTELSGVEMDYSQSPDELGILLNKLSYLPQNIKSLRLTMRESNLPHVLSSLVHLIGNTASLRELDLRFFPKSWTSEERPERQLLQALSSNEGIRRVTLHGINYDETDTDMLAKLLCSSRTLCYLSFRPEDGESVPLLLRKLSTDVSGNFTLLGVQVGHVPEESIGDKFFVDDATRRNNALATRAAHFVLGTRHKYCAVAGELARLHPGLVMKVQQLAAVSEEEAVSRIKTALKSIVELDDFMSLAGVVKHSVSCETSDDGEKQLLDLNFECWLHIRQYLKFEDIRN